MSSYNKKPTSRKLSNRQEQILEMIVMDEKSETIAMAYNLSPKTIQHHRHAMMVKLNAHTTLMLVAAAIATGRIRNPYAWALKVWSRRPKELETLGEDGQPASSNAVHRHD